MTTPRTRALVPYLPGGGGHVLITSRNPDWHELATPLSVDVFDRQESISLLRQRRATGLSEHEADRIAAAVEDLPLAASQAATFLTETGCAVQEYLELLTDRAVEVLAQGAPVIYPASLAASWQLAFDRLAVDEPAALDLLMVAAHLVPEPVPFTLLSAHTDRLPEPLATTVGDSLAFAGLTRLLRRRALARVGADHLQTRGEPRSAQPLFERAFELRQRLLGDDHPDTLTSASNLGVDLSELGEYERARQLKEDILTRYRRVLGEDHPDTLESANNLAIDLCELGEHERARQLNEDTLTRYRRVLGHDHPRTLISANNLGAVLRELGEHEWARQLDEDTLARRRRVLGDDHPNTLISANNLGADLRELGEHERARRLEDLIQMHRWP